MSLQTYTSHFFGFGRWDAPVWFVGTEEAGNPTPEQFNHRVSRWVQRGQRELEDAPAFYPAVGQTDWHGEHAELERTWRQLIRMMLLARGQPDTTEALLAYQQTLLGAFSGDVCLTELSPMPAPGHRRWPYAAWAAAPQWLRSRDTFTHRIRPARFATLREKIAAHRPRAVVFYFWKPRECAETIAGGEFQPLLPEKLLGFQRDGTQYFVTGHPATGYPDSYFQELGDYFYANHKQLFAAHVPSQPQTTDTSSHPQPSAMNPPLKLPAFGDLDPARLLAADELFAIVSDKFPISPGHTLIIARRPVARFQELTSCNAAGFSGLTQS